MAKRSAALFTAAPRATIDAAKALYEDGASLADIAARLTIAASTVSRYAKLESWVRPGAAAASPRRAVKKRVAKKKTATRATKALAPPSTTKRAPNTRAALENAARRDDADRVRVAPTAPEARLPSLVARLFDAAERQVSDIEERIGAPAEDAAGRERDARALAVLTRMLRELASLDAVAAQTGAAKSAPDEEEEHDIERVVEEYRAKVARILAGLEAARNERDGADGGDAASSGSGDLDELVLPGEG